MNDEELNDYELEVLRAGERQDLINDEVLICECMCVSARDIRNLFTTSESIELETLKDKFQLGAGCSSCVKSYSSWKNKIFLEEE